MARLAVLVAVFMLFGSCIGNDITRQIKECELDMALDSVDDMYNKCEKEMEEEVEKTFLPNELNKNENFKQAWSEAEKYYNNEWEKKNLHLKKKEIMAAHAYTLNVPPLYREFNNAVRKQKSEYKTKFPYHSLHFYLTTALRAIKPTAENCVTVFRRTNCKYDQDVLNKEIRFGSFTSSSMDGYSDEKYGNESCFEISTCFGADISQFSKYAHEKEVLIPPYEVFKVTEIKKSKLPCEVVYKLKSTKTTRSNLNCDLFNKESLLGLKPKL